MTTRGNCVSSTSAGALVRSTERRNDEPPGVKNGWDEWTGLGERPLPVAFRPLAGAPLRGGGPARRAARFFGDTVLPCPKVSVESVLLVRSQS